MSEVRKVAALDGMGYSLLMEEEVPPVKAGMVKVRVRASLISAGTELASAAELRCNPPAEKPAPRAFGYQNAGDVVEVGESVTEFRAGDRVACMGGGYALHSDIAVVPQKLCAHLPAEVSYEEGAVAHLAITALNAIRRGKPELGEYLLVAGLGLVGQIGARLGQIAGMYVMGWDTNNFRCDLAKSWGIDAVSVVGKDDTAELAAEFTRGYGFDMAVMAFGGEGSAALKSIARVMKKTPDTHEMGRICMVGGAFTTSQWGAGLGNLDLLSCARSGPGYHDEEWEFGRTEYPGVFVRWNTRDNMNFVLRLMAEKKLDVRCLLTHTYQLAEVNEAVNGLVEHPEDRLGTILKM